MVVDDGPSRGRVPARGAGRRRAAAQGERGVRRRAPQGGRRAEGPRPTCRRASRWRCSRCGGGRHPSGCRRRPSARPDLAGAWRTSTSMPHEGDDYIGVQTYSRRRGSAPSGGIGNEDGVETAIDGLRVLARVARGDDAAGRGTSRTAHADHRHRERDPATDDDANASTTCAARCDGVLALHRRRRSTCAATRTGACSTTSSGRTATGPPSGSSE